MKNMREKFEQQFSETEISEKQEKAQEMDKKAKEMIDKGEAKTPQEAIEKLGKKELQELLESKAKDAYTQNNVVRFTNAAFLDDVFITKNAFKGDAMLVMKGEDYKKYYSERKRNFIGLPQGKATLGTLVDQVYRERHK